MTTLATRDCPCEQTISMGQKRPERCTHGNRFQTAAELQPKHRKPLVRASSPSQSKGLKRTQRQESSVEKKARDNFNEAVTEWPCFFSRWRQPHKCNGPKDAHHLVEKQWIRRNYADLPSPELAAILFDPRIGSPLCRYTAHDAITRKATHIYWDELTEDCIEFCREVDARYLGQLTPAGIRRQSMLVRLEQECPKRKESQSNV